jgi:probable rRNA maturation factor
MITFNYETPFVLEAEPSYEKWIETVILNHGFTLGEINYIEFLQHDTLTDVISFDNTIGKIINGDIYISIERVADNAEDYKVLFLEELHRVMIHGVLHYLGFKDKDPVDKKAMTLEEDRALSFLTI